MVQAWPRTTALAAVAVLLLAMLTMNALIYFMDDESSFMPLLRWARWDTVDGHDSWGVMHIAREWLRTHADTSQLYQDIFFTQNHKFQYAPTSLLMLDVLSAVGVTPTVEVLNTVNRVLLGVTALAVGAIGFLLMKRLAPANDSDSRIARLVAGPLGAAFTLCFYPMVWAYDVGQAQVWINFFFVAAVLAWLLERRIAAGVLIGLICLLKPQFALFLVWGLIRREWAFSIALTATAAAGLLISIALYGFGSHVAYLSVLSHLSQHGESFWANQSVNGILNRLLGNGPIANFEGAFPPFNIMVYLGTMLTTAGILALALFIRRREGELASLTDFLLAATAFTIASPIAWEHHYGVFAPAFVVLILIWATSAPSRSYLITAAGLGIALFFAANVFPIVKNFTGVLTLVQAHLFFAGLAVFFMLRNGARAPRFKSAVLSLSATHYPHA
jgi:alpha-1,2-mannosyltransferase